MTELSNRPGSSPEATARYVGRLRSMGGEDPVEALAAFPQRLEQRVAGLPRSDLMRCDGEGRWSVLQVLEHLADHEMIVGVRIRMILAHDEPEIQPFDQDLWADRLHWRERELIETLDDFAAFRRRNLRLIRALSTSELDRAGLHRERGRETVRHFVELTAGHDLAHLAQIDRILTAPPAPGVKT